MKKLTFGILIVGLILLCINESLAQSEEETTDIGVDALFNLDPIGTARCTIRVSSELLVFFDAPSSKVTTKQNQITIDRENEEIAFRLRTAEDDASVFDLFTTLKGIDKNVVLRLLAGQVFAGRASAGVFIQRKLSDGTLLTLNTVSDDPGDILQEAVVHARLKKIFDIKDPETGEKITVANGNQKIRFRGAKIKIKSSDDAETEDIVSGVIVVSCKFKKSPLENGDLDQINECIQAGDCPVGEGVEVEGLGE